MSNSFEDSTLRLPLDTHLHNEDESIRYQNLMQQAANMDPVDPFEQRRSIHFIASINGSLAGPRDFVYYDTTLDTNLPAIATNSLRLCTEPNDLPPGTDTLTYPGYHQQIASVSGLHAPIIEDRSPLLAAAFEDSRSGRRLHLETLTSNTVMPFLRFIYTGSYALFGGWEDVPTSVLLHCRMYWLGDLYDLPELKSQAYVNVLRQFEFGCSSPEKPIDLCSAIDFVYKTLPGHDAISDAIVQYCVTQCLSHKLHEDTNFKSLAFNVRAFHRDLTRVCRDRGFEDESSAMIIRLPYKHFAPDTYASLENPPIAGFDDIIHHFHSSDRFDEESTSQVRRKLALVKEQAPAWETLRVLVASKQPTSLAACTSSNDASPPLPAVALPIRQANVALQAPASAYPKQEDPIVDEAFDDLAKLSTAPPNPGFFGRRLPTRDHVPTRMSILSNPGADIGSDPQEGNYTFAEDKPLHCSPLARYRERRARHARFNLELERDIPSGNKTDSQQTRHGHGLPEAQPIKKSHQEFLALEPRSLVDAMTLMDDPFVNYKSPEASQSKAQKEQNEKQSSVPEANEHAKEIKRRKVEGLDRKDSDSSHPRLHPAFAQLQSPHSVAPSYSHASWGQRHGKTRPVNLQNVNKTDVAHFRPSNVSPTLPPTVFGAPQSIIPASSSDPDPRIVAGNTPVPTATINAGHFHVFTSSSGPELTQISHSMKPLMNTMVPATVPPPVPINTSGNHALQDYQMQLMLLEQQNKKRFLMARQEQDSWSHPPGMRTGLNGHCDPKMSPEGSRAGGPLRTLTEMANANVAPPTSDHDIKTAAGFNASGVAENGREVDVLEEFDFDAFLGSDEGQPDFFWQDPQDDRLQMRSLASEAQRQQPLEATSPQGCSLGVPNPAGQPMGIAPPIFGK